MVLFFPKIKTIILYATLIFDKQIKCLQNPGDTYDSTFEDASSSSGYSCQQCISNGWIFATSLDWHSLIASGGNYNGYCCGETFDSDCTAYDADEADLILSGYKLSTDFTSKDLAVAACP
jgi:hypothetical protein